LKNGLTHQHIQLTKKNLTEFEKIRESHIKRTIYVGNLCPQIKEEHIRSFFSTQGKIKLIKMSGPGMDNNYCFVEFYDEVSAERSHSLTGTILGDRAIKIGNVKTPIGSTGAAVSILSNPMKLSQAMTNARYALEAIVKKKVGSGSVVKEKKKRRRRRSRSPRRRSRSHRSRTRSRSRSSHSRRKRRRRRRRRSRSNSSRSRSRARRRNAITGALGGRHDRKADMVWDGFNWFPKGSSQAEATKKAEEVSASGPRPVVVNKTFTGVALAQEALKNFTHGFAPPGL